MPTYEYRCTDCEHDFALEASLPEYERGLDAPCPACRSANTVRRIGAVVLSDDDADATLPEEDRCAPGTGCC